MSELFHTFQLEDGSFIATGRLDDKGQLFVGWYVPLSSKLEPATVEVTKLENGKPVMKDGKEVKVKKLDLQWLPSSAVPARLCMKHHAWWTDAGPCPQCQPRPVSVRTSEPAVEPAF